MNYYQRKQYSRLARVEELKNKRTAFKYSVLTLGFIIFSLLFVIYILPKFVSFVTDLNSSDENISQVDETAPAPPQIYTLPEATSSGEVEVKGSAEAGAVINIYINKNKKEVLSDVNSSFSAFVKLEKGKNTISAKAIDSAGNESISSQTYEVIYDTEKPPIEITKPSDGEQFYGSSQKQITVEGTTDPDAKVTINDRVVIIDSIGKFSFPTTLGDGENTFNIKSTDKAGNQTELTIKVNYSP